MSMDGRAIGAAAVSDGGLRRLATELGGPRPAGTPAHERAERETAAAPAADRAARATRP